jgi:hypothetical protein
MRRLNRHKRDDLEDEYFIKDMLMAFLFKVRGYVSVEKSLFLKIYVWILI